MGLIEALPLHNHDHDHDHEIVSHEHGNESSDNDHDHESHSHDDEHEKSELEGFNFLSLSGWSAVIIVILSGILIESLVTGLIIRFFSKVRPDFIDSAHLT